jgi:nitroreductase
MKSLEGTLSVSDAIFARRSIRSFRSDKLQEPIVRALLDAAVQAPSALFRPHVAFVVLQDAQELHRLSELTKASWRSELATNRYRYLDVHEETLQQFSDPRFDVFHGATTLIVICDRGGDAFGAADCWLAAENLMMAASAQGLGSRCVGAAAPALNSAEMRRDLGIPPVVTAVAPVVIGIPLASDVTDERHEPDVLTWR